jgi:predicted nucleotidyltransferase
MTPAHTGLADALFSKTQQRVLGLLFGQPERSFFATEIIGLAGGGSGAVQRELKRLEESGLVMVTRVGTQKHYQANAAAPVFAELCGLLRKTVGLAEPLRAALLPLGERIQLALLYGSVAKQSDRAASDIDVLVVGDDLTLEEVYTALAPAERQLGRAVSPTLYTCAEFERRRTDSNAFIARMLAGEHVMLIGEEPDGAGAVG